MSCGMNVGLEVAVLLVVISEGVRDCSVLVSGRLPNKNLALLEVGQHKIALESGFLPNVGFLYVIVLVLGARIFQELDVTGPHKRYELDILLLPKLLNGEDPLQPEDEKQELVLEDRSRTCHRNGMFA
eukprot:TRINITY_DN986_c0_g1_i1.p4 TRINITY_DN986_c0_g1~~TRINITY_DN986_c0_g1_i1.p4  ORF type:complete len:128 (-),score=7.43 TRINITY_DN986_c0_g1_i1:703-1086(-)